MTEQEASDPATSAQRLLELSADPQMRILIAGNPASPAHLLESLAHDQDTNVREKVAGNPNTPWPTLKNLAWEFPSAFLHNPAGSVHAIAHAGQINTDETLWPEHMSPDEPFWRELLREESIPFWWSNWLEHHSLLSQSSAVRLHIQFAGETTSFCGSLLPGEERDLLTLVELLTAASTQQVTLPPLPVNTLSDRSTVTCEQIVREHLRWLALCSQAQIRQEVVAHPYVPIEVLQMLARDRNLKVRAGVARHLQSPPEVLQMLAQDKSIGVREAVARNPRTPPEILQLLSQNPGEQMHQETEPKSAEEGPLTQEIDVEIIHIPLGLPWSKQLMEAPPGSFPRIAVAENPQAPPELLRVLAEDQLGAVRVAVARNPRTPPEILRRLIVDPDLRGFIASHPQVPVDVLQSLAQDKAWNVKLALAENMQTPIEVLRLLVQDEDDWMLEVVARSPRVPTESLQMLANSQVIGVRCAVAGNEQTPVELLSKLATDQEEAVRRMVAGNTRTPTDILHSLAQDSYIQVRRGVAWNGQTSMEVLQALAQDQNAEVRWLANLVQTLLREADETFRQQKWWQDFKILFMITDAENPMMQDILLETCLGGITELDVSEPVRRSILAAFASSWDASMIREAFAGRVSPTNYRAIMVPFMPSTALRQLAISPFWEIRYLVALHTQTPEETRQDLCQDGNRYVRAMARAKTAWIEEESADQKDR